MNITESLDMYVIATLGSPTMYLCRINGEYYFADNLKECTKFTERNIGEAYKHYFYQDTGLREIDLVVLPLKIEYRLINEMDKVTN